MWQHLHKVLLYKYKEIWIILHKNVKLKYKIHLFIQFGDNLKWGWDAMKKQKFRLTLSLKISLAVSIILIVSYTIIFTSVLMGQYNDSINRAETTAKDMISVYSNQIGTEIKS